MKKHIYIAPQLWKVNMNLTHMIAATNEVDGDHIKTDDDSMEEGDGDDAAVKFRDVEWGNLW